MPWARFLKKAHSVLQSAFSNQKSEQRWRQEFSNGGLTLPMSGLKYDFQGTVNAKNI